MLSYSSNCSIQSKDIRNKKYYEENRENLKKGVRFRLNINVTKEREDSWLNAINTKILFVKDRLNLSSKITTAAKAHLMESLLDNWLKKNHIIVDTIIFYFGAGLNYIQLLCDVQIKPLL